MPAACEMWPRSAWRELNTTRNTVSPFRGMVTDFTTSGGCTPRAYQPIAFGPFTMNMAARSMYWPTSLTR